jgi:hypothetical protein
MTNKELFEEFASNMALAVAAAWGHSEDATNLYLDRALLVAKELKEKLDV